MSPYMDAFITYSIPNMQSALILVVVEPVTTVILSVRNVTFMLVQVTASK